MGKNAAMKKNVLIVDDEKSFLLSLVQGLEAYAEHFNTLSAPNGRAALDVLQKNSIDLVVTDLKMPEMDGYGLLAYMIKTYPGIPVIVMSAYCTPETKSSLQSIGSFKILEKPIDFQDFVDAIFTELQAVATGYINGITLPAFIQLVEMEKKTCTLRITSRGRKGSLYFLEGVLMDADNGVDKHETAALDIVCWDDAAIEIESVCAVKERNIKATLGYILLEGFRVLDEQNKVSGGRRPDPPPSPAADAPKADKGGKTSEEHNAAAAASKKEEKMATTREILSELAKMQNIEAVCLVARDGFLLDSIARSGIDREMIGAIASSGFGASSSMGRQLEKGSMMINMIEFEKGPVMLAPIGEDAFLVIIADREANLGMIRLKLKKHSGELALAAAI
jgi:predicted regulator of Ras-like GTPase activity (Roadblock/LC7/MglB family)/CheY-like chemotaxis protein